MWQMTDPTIWFKQQQEKHLHKAYLRKNANLAATAVLALFGTQFALSFVQVFPAVQNVVGLFAGQSIYHYLIYYMILYTLMIGTPLLIGWLLFRKASFPPLVQRTEIGLSLSLIVGGMGLCIAANIFNNYILNFLMTFGIVPQASASLQDGSFGVLLFNILIVGILPALLEELLFRGVILGALRPAGDRVAILVSALLFSLIHTTLYQIPFAFLLGLIFGYLQVRTNNIWLPIAVHFLNNTMSVVVEYATWGRSEETASAAVAIVFTVVALCGILALCVLLYYHRSACAPIGDRPRSPLTAGERRRAVLFAPVMIVSIVLMVLMTLGNIDFQIEGSIWDGSYYEDSYRDTPPIPDDTPDHPLAWQPSEVE